ncbi:hypothetical protein B7486_67790, partial [cyanobacterium TDX16]
SHLDLAAQGETRSSTSSVAPTHLRRFLGGPRRVLRALALLPLVPLRMLRRRRAERLVAERLARLGRPLETPARFGDAEWVIDRELGKGVGDRLRTLQAIDSPEYLLAAYGAVARFVPPRPREMKRMVNRIRFFLFLSERRGLLEDGIVGPEHVGKWALLTEQWSEFTAEVSRNPEVLSQLEPAGRGARGFAEVMSTSMPHVEPSADLAAVVDASPPMGVVAERLARLRRAAVA